MSSSNEINHDEDITADLMSTLSAALLINPKFNFGKLMELSIETNSENNKSTLVNIIAIAFLTYFEMPDAVEVLSADDIAARAGFAALNLDKKEALSWFIKFIVILNPGILANFSQTLMSVVNGMMIQNTRSHDADRLERVKAKMDSFIDSGEHTRRSERSIEDKPTQERSHKRAVSDLGLIGWMTGHNANVRKNSKSSSSSSGSTKKYRELPNSKPSSKKLQALNKAEDIEDRESLSEYLSKINLTETPVKPNDSVSNVSSNSGSSKVKTKQNVNNKKKGKQVIFRKDDSIVSG